MQILPNKKFGEFQPTQFVPEMSHLAQGAVHAEQSIVSVTRFSTPNNPSKHLQVTVPLPKSERRREESQEVQIFSEVHSLQPIGHWRQTPFFI